MAKVFLNISVLIKMKRNIIAFSTSCIHYDES